MIKSNHSMPIIGLNGKSLANTDYEWQCGNELFRYYRNNEGYRSENFVNAPTFLFAGCSETFGESAEYETTWAYKLFHKIKNKEDIYCNVGLPGIDVGLVIHHILMFIEKYGKPKNIFAIFPHFNRMIETSKDKTSTVIVTRDPKDGRHKSDNIEFSYPRMINIIQSGNLLQIKNFERLCNELDINLIWSTWCNESSNKASEEEIFNDYISIVNDKDMTDLALDLGYSVSNIKLVRADGNHHGEIFHEYWSQIFEKEYYRRKSIADGTPT